MKIKNEHMNVLKKDLGIVGYTTGVYDLFHIGHLNLLRRARAECDYLVVGVTTDELCALRKGRQPIIPFVERCQIIEALRFVDAVVPQDSMDKMMAWEQIRFQKMFVGDDWKGHETWAKLEAAFTKIDVEIVYFPYTTHTSSSLLREVIQKL